MQYRLPSLREYYILKSGNLSQCIEVARDISGLATIGEIRIFITQYLDLLDNTRKNTPQLTAPYLPRENDLHYTCATGDMKVVADYTRHNFSELWDMDIFTLSTT